MAQQSGSNPATPQPVSGILPPESIPPDLLGEFKSSLALAEWTLAIEGEWYEDAYHGGSVSYLIRRHESGAWVFKSSERNTCLDDLTMLRCSPPRVPCTSSSWPAAASASTIAATRACWLSRSDGRVGGEGARLSSGRVVRVALLPTNPPSQRATG
jgi:hypothetical protein